MGGKLFGGNVQSGSLVIQKGLVALLRDFDFPARFTVNSFEMVYSSGGKLEKFIAVGPMFSEAMTAKLKGAKQGDIVVFDEIALSGLDGMPRKVKAMTFIII